MCYFLTRQSGLEIALEKIYCIAPAFRAEKSKTSRHLTELWMNEMEGAWLTFKDIQDYGEKLIKYIDQNQVRFVIINSKTPKIQDNVPNELRGEILYKYILRNFKKHKTIDNFIILEKIYTS